MTTGPQVTVSGGPGGDLLGEDPPSRARPQRLLGLALAAAVGFAAAQAVPAGSADAEPSLALVTGRQPFLDAVGGPSPVTSMEVVLVNTGPSAVRLTGASVEGSGLRWEADRLLDPGEQVTAVVREQGVCDREPDALSAPGPTRQLAVQVEGAPTQRLTLGPAVGRLYDDHARVTCALPRLPDALDVVQAGTTTTDAGVDVGIELQSRSVEPLTVLEVRLGAGLAASLVDRQDRPVALPLTVPGRTREEIAQGYVVDATTTSPYRLRVAATPGACADLRAAAQGTAEAPLRVVYAAADDPRTTAERPLFLDLPELARRICS